MRRHRRELVSQWASGKTFRGVCQERPRTAVGREEMNVTEMWKGNLKNINEFVNRISFDVGLKEQVSIIMTLTLCGGIKKVNSLR